MNILVWRFWSQTRKTDQLNEERLRRLNTLTLRDVGIGRGEIIAVSRLICNSKCEAANKDSI